MNKIESPKILIVEGSHEKRFFSRLLEIKGIVDVQVMDIGGKTCLKPNLRVLIKDPSFDTVNSIGIMRDADENFQTAIDAVQAAIRNAGLSLPNQPSVKTQSNPAMSFFIFPNNNDPGSLEDLCLESVKAFPTIDCVEKYMECISRIQGHHPRYSKAAVQVFLAKEEEGDVSMSTASDKNVWPWGSHIFTEVISFITNL